MFTKALLGHILKLSPHRSKSETIARQETILIHSTRLSINSCFRPLTFAFHAFEFLSQLFQPIRKFSK